MFSLNRCFGALYEALGALGNWKPYSQERQVRSFFACEAKAQVNKKNISWGRKATTIPGTWTKNLLLSCRLRKFTISTLNRTLSKPPNGLCLPGTKRLHPNTEGIPHRPEMRSETRTRGWQTQARALRRLKAILHWHIPLRSRASIGHALYSLPRVVQAFMRPLIATEQQRINILPHGHANPKTEAKALSKITPNAKKCSAIISIEIPPEEQTLHWHPIAVQQEERKYDNLVY